MAAAPTDWKQITPDHLIPAVEHIRKSFASNDWKYSQVTRNLCYTALHPEAREPAALAPYHTAFTTYQKIVGRTAEQQFDDLLRIGTPPAVFRAYFDAYQKGLEVEVGNQFNLILQIGLTNAQGLELLPVEWAKSHLQLLIERQVYHARMWIRRVCDKEDSSLALGALESLEEAVIWKAWRAPRLIHMHPAGNTPYDAAFAWAWEDEQRSRELLENRSRRFIQFLEIHLAKIVGDAHVQLAQHTAPQVAQSLANAKGGTPYPSEFSAEARARVEIEMLKASKDLAQQRNEVPWSQYGPGKADEENLQKYILRVFLVFAKQACELGAQGQWAVDRIRSEAGEFLRRFTIRAYYESGFDKKGRKLREMASHWNGTILPEVQREFEKSQEWQQFEKELLAVAELQIQLTKGFVPNRARPVPDADRKQVAPVNSGAAPVALLSKYRSELKRGILIQLTRNPRATDNEICSGLDADGSVELPASWRVNRGGRSFTTAYLDARLRRRIEIAISKIRADLRKQGLLDRR
jgi:hypothetical protein